MRQKKKIIFLVLMFFALLTYADNANREGTMANTDTWRELTPAETRVIVEKGTERPFSGKYDKAKLAGVYTCRRCGAALYRSEDKFDSGCGWPAFDAEINGAVKRLPDADGQRTEIQCAHCGGHLGHVFTGERLTDKNVRHCVNSISLDFVPAPELANHFERAIVAGGCFWGVEYYLEQLKGVIRAVSGYTGGHTATPTYEQVCSGRTGHVEAVEVLFDPRQVSYEAILKRFFEIHDPTQTDGQGPDLGEQYHSVIFYLNPAQRETAEKLIDTLRRKGYRIATRLSPATVFYPAENYHRQYYRKNGKTPYCHRPVNRFD